MKLNSKAATIAAAAVIVVLGGGSGAYASGLIDGGDIQNGSITTVDVADGSIKTYDIKDASILGKDIHDGTLTTSDLAAGANTSATTEDNSLEGRDIANDSLTSADIQDRTIEYTDLATGVADQIVANAKGGGQLDSNGALSYSWKGDPTAIPSTEVVPAGSLVTMNVSGVDQPTQVTLKIGDTPITCVAGPVGDLSGTCSAFAVAGGTVSRVETGGDTQVTVELVGTKVS